MVENIPAILSALAALGGTAMQHFGKKDPSSTEQLQTGTAQQRDWQNQLGQMAMQGFQDPSAGFQPIEDRARRQFHSETMPSIAERFASLGGNRSSAYNAALTGAGQEFEGDLASMRGQYGIQNRNSLANLMQMGLAPQFSNMYQAEAPGLLQTLGASLGGAGIGTLGEMLGGKYLGGLDDERQAKAIEAYQKEGVLNREESQLKRAHELAMAGRTGG